MLNPSSALLATALLAPALLSPSSHAWEKHQSLMEGSLKSLGDAVPEFNNPVTATCPEEDQATYSRLAKELQLNPKAKVLPTSPDACARKVPIPPKEILDSFAVDEPDFGMDENLPGPPESY